MGERLGPGYGRVGFRYVSVYSERNFFNVSHVAMV